MDSRASASHSIGPAGRLRPGPQTAEATHPCLGRRGMRADGHRVCPPHPEGLPASQTSRSPVMSPWPAQPVTGWPGDPRPGSGFTPKRLTPMIPPPSEDMRKHPFLHPTVVDPAPDRRGRQAWPQNAARARQAPVLALWTSRSPESTWDPTARKLGCRSATSVPPGDASASTGDLEAKSPLKGLDPLFLFHKETSDKPAPDSGPGKSVPRENWPEWQTRCACFPCRGCQEALSGSRADSFPSSL